MYPLLLFKALGLSISMLFLHKEGMAGIWIAVLYIIGNIVSVPIGT